MDELCCLMDVQTVEPLNWRQFQGYPEFKGLSQTRGRVIQSLVRISNFQLSLTYFGKPVSRLGCKLGTALLAAENLVHPGNI